MRKNKIKIWCLLMIFLGLISPSIHNMTGYAQGLDWLFGDQGRQIYSKQELSQEDLEIINNLYSSLKTFYIEDVSKEQLMEGALKGMVSALGDPYSEFLNADESQAYEETEEGSFSGVGIQFMSKNGLITVISAIEGTPAGEAGIQPNDIIKMADGTELTDMNTTEVIQLIRGPIGSEVTLTIQRADQVFDVILKREEIPIITVEGSIDENHKKVGKVQISQFNGTTYNELIEVVTNLREEGAKSFVFDLRYNPGGLLDQALQISNMFLEDGQIIMQMQEGKEEPYTYEASDKDYGDFQITEPYVILVNEGSASASEILTGAVKENTDHPIVGGTTFGKGSVQTFTNPSYLGELKITFAKWLLPSGTWIHDTGIEPTVEVEAEAVEKAITINPENEIQIGDVTAEVESLGLILDALGYLEEPLKYFNESMEVAVKAFQKDNQLEETGIVTGETTNKLSEEIRYYFETHDKQYEEAVKALQEYEAELEQAA